MENVPGRFETSSEESQRTRQCRLRTPDGDQSAGTWMSLELSKQIKVSPKVSNLTKDDFRSKLSAMASDLRSESLSTNSPDSQMQACAASWGNLGTGNESR
jgi:hypothetical protein